MFRPSLWANELEYRRTVLKVVLCIIIFAGSIFVVNNWLNGFKIYALIELAVVLFSVGLLAIHKKTPNLTLWSSFFLFAVYTVILIGIFTVAFKAALYTWLFLIPVLSYLLLGITLGNVFTCVYVFAGVAILCKALLGESSEIPVISVVNISLCLSAIWALSYTYESKRAAMVEQLQQMASLDPLTGLNNRLLLDSSFEMLCESLPERQRTVSMLLIDLDHFKKVNDKYGHHVGDKVLIEVASLINETRRLNDWAFRLGGEEFCMLIPDTSEVQAQNIAERIRLAVEKTITIDDIPINISISIGVSHWPSNGKTLNQLYKLADDRLYRAKEAGRNRVIAH
ncbi:GGDEF domain-containing protein [Paraglaciecola chathamensis]|jgi:diguanylate cyclase (GGDEF)-like protein|uniref:diguanylate cyclase n=1 Tax=Paraglaciecola chathamensis TaxID=368405 RepID=A0ABS0WKQ3_9ALTE|nr:GGDEF domain-containing protein [Paraglaciecola chathamensis]MBJ2139017.1 GGDEF domain-containing protein [Paraglaciecola chathamensis]